MIILDFGSGSTSKNDVATVRRMIDELVKVDTGKHEIVIKWQLFTDCPPNEPLRRDVFDYAYNYANERGYQTTASVFDSDSLQFLLTYDIPFVKIANRPDLYWLAGEVPRKIPVYVSFGDEDIDEEIEYENVLLYCASKYPATVNDYSYYIINRNAVLCQEIGTCGVMGLSDHTTDFTLYHKYKPEIYEVHYKLNDSTGPDSGPFSRTPEQLSEIL